MFVFVRLFVFVYVFMFDVLVFYMCIHIALKIYLTILRFARISLLVATKNNHICAYMQHYVHTHTGFALMYGYIYSYFRIVDLDMFIFMCISKTIFMLVFMVIHLF